MSYTETVNAPWLYVYVAVVLLGCLAQTLIMMAKAWKHARELGMEDAQIRKGLINGIVVSIFPTIPVFIVFMYLTTTLGAPLPWLRLSVIGSATIESLGATLGVTAADEELVLGGVTLVGWVSACWVMSIAGSSNVLWSTIMTKPISSLYGMAEKFNIRLVLIIGTGFLMGIMAYSTVSFGLSSPSDKGVVFMSSFLLGSLMVYLSKKFPKQKWINDFLMAICMIFGMFVACIAF